MTMLLKWALASAALFLLVAAWIAVQRTARRFAERHPDSGPYRAAGCGGCGSGHCASDAPPAPPSAKHAATDSCNH